MNKHIVDPVQPASSTQSNYWDVISNVLSDAVIGIRADASVEFCNLAACELFKLDWPQASNISIFDLFQNFSTLLPINSSCFDNISQVTESQREIYDTGSELCLHWHVIPITPSQREGACLILVAKPIASNDVIAEHLKELINCIPGSVYWKDKDGVYLGCNQFMVETSGLWAIEDIVGKADQELWPLNATQLRANDMRVLMTGEVISNEEVIQIPDGTEMWFSTVKMPLKSPSGAIIGVIGNSVDISDRKRSEHELALAKAEAEHANQTKAAFLKNMEHDLRTPFTGLYGLTQLLWKRESDPEKKELLGLATHSAKQLLDICISILEFSRNGDCGIKVAQRVFDLTYLLQRVMDIEMPPAYLKNIKLSLCCEQDVPRWIVGDQHRVFRILVNLMSNAVKFTESGSVVLQVKLLAQDADQLQLQFRIEDTGIGLSKRKQDQIMALFVAKSYQAEVNNKVFGLGLINVKKFIDELDGSIKVDTKQEGGTIFTCDIPFHIHSEVNGKSLPLTTPLN